MLLKRIAFIAVHFVPRHLVKFVTGRVGGGAKKSSSSRETPDSSVGPQAELEDDTQEDLQNQDPAPPDPPDDPALSWLSFVASIDSSADLDPPVDKEDPHGAQDPLVKHDHDRVDPHVEVLDERPPRLRGTSKIRRRDVEVPQEKVDLISNRTSTFLEQREDDADTNFAADVHLEPPSSDATNATLAAARKTKKRDHSSPAAGATTSASPEQGDAEDEDYKNIIDNAEDEDISTFLHINTNTGTSKSRLGGFFNSIASAFRTKAGLRAELDAEMEEGRRRIAALQSLSNDTLQTHAQLLLAAHAEDSAADKDGMSAQLSSASKMLPELLPPLLAMSRLTEALKEQNQGQGTNQLSRDENEHDGASSPSSKKDVGTPTTTSAAPGDENKEAATATKQNEAVVADGGGTRREAVGDGGKNDGDALHRDGDPAVDEPETQAAIAKQDAVEDRQMEEMQEKWRSGQLGKSELQKLADQEGFLLELARKVLQDYAAALDAIDATLRGAEESATATKTSGPEGALDESSSATQEQLSSSSSSTPAASTVPRSGGDPDKSVVRHWMRGMKMMNDGLQRLWEAGSEDSALVEPGDKSVMERKINGFALCLKAELLLGTPGLRLPGRTEDKKNAPPPGMLDFSVLGNGLLNTLVADIERARKSQQDDSCTADGRPRTSVVVPGFLELLGLSFSDEQDPFVVTSITPKSVAAESGVRTGDRLVALLRPGVQNPDEKTIVVNGSSGEVEEDEVPIDQVLERIPWVANNPDNVLSSTSVVSTSSVGGAPEQVLERTSSSFFQEDEAGGTGGVERNPDGDDSTTTAAQATAVEESSNPISSPATKNKRRRRRTKRKTFTTAHLSAFLRGVADKGPAAPPSSFLDDGVETTTSSKDLLASTEFRKSALEKIFNEFLLPRNYDLVFKSEKTAAQIASARRLRLDRLPSRLAATAAGKLIVDPVTKQVISKTGQTTGTNSDNGGASSFVGNEIPLGSTLERVTPTADPEDVAADLSDVLDLFPKSTSKAPSATATSLRLEEDLTDEGSEHQEGGGNEVARILRSSRLPVILDFVEPAGVVGATGTDESAPGAAHHERDATDLPASRSAASDEAEKDNRNGASSGTPPKSAWSISSSTSSLWSRLTGAGTPGEQKDSSSPPPSDSTTSDPAAETPEERAKRLTSEAEIKRIRDQLACICGPNGEKGSGSATVAMMRRAMNVFMERMDRTLEGANDTQEGDATEHEPEVEAGAHDKDEQRAKESASGDFLGEKNIERTGTTGTAARRAAAPDHTASREDNKESEPFAPEGGAPTTREDKKEPQDSVPQQNGMNSAEQEEEQESASSLQQTPGPHEDDPQKTHEKENGNHADSAEEMRQAFAATLSQFLVRTMSGLPLASPAKGTTSTSFADEEETEEAVEEQVEMIQQAADGSFSSFLERRASSRSSSRKQPKLRTFGDVALMRKYKNKRDANAARARADMPEEFDENLDYTSWSFWNEPKRYNDVSTKLPEFRMFLTEGKGDDVGLEALQTTGGALKALIGVLITVAALVVGVKFSGLAMLIGTLGPVAALIIVGALLFGYFSLPSNFAWRWTSFFVHLFISVVIFFFVYIFFWVLKNQKLVLFWIVMSLVVLPLLHLGGGPFLVLAGIPKFGALASVAAFQPPVMFAGVVNFHQAVIGGSWAANQIWKIFALQKYRTSINCITNFSKNKNAICHAISGRKLDLSCISAISTSAILLHRIRSYHRPGSSACKSFCGTESTGKGRIKRKYGWAWMKPKEMFCACIQVLDACRCLS
ncbi:unnamed protein product [Amoebophrya sp. A120]|nr:unnamed protein product [Amoebophrya sp. A120]|eukprot:GSA120T00004864001.1